MNAERTPWNIASYFLLPLMAMLMSCATVGQGGIQGELDQARSKWRVARPSNYTYTYSLSCFCPRELTDRVRITVQNAKVDNVIYTNTGQPVDLQHLQHFHTIDELFDMLQDAINRDPHQMAASYDPSYGYPTSVTIDYNEMIADEEMRFTADSLQPAE